MITLIIHFDNESHTSTINDILRDIELHIERSPALNIIIDIDKDTDKNTVDHIIRMTSAMVRKDD